MVVQLRCSFVEDSKAVAELIEEKAGQLNVVIANAGTFGL